MCDYHVVAIEMPIVYTPDGDHDPNGLVFVPKVLEPLFKYAKDRWEDFDERLPRLHFARQRAQLVVDGLERLEEMLHRLREGPDDDQDLLAELIRRESVPSYGEPDDRLSHGLRRRSHRSGAVRYNIEAQLQELRIALTDLGDPDGPAHWFQPGETEHQDDTATPSNFPLVNLSTAQRAEWRQHWQTQLEMLDRAIESWFTHVNADPERKFDPDKYAASTGMSAKRVKRLMYNDHTYDVRHLGTQAPPYDRFNPMRPLPLIEPLVLRTHVGRPVTVKVENQIRGRRVGFHVQGDGLAGQGGKGVRYGDGARIGTNPDTTIEYANSRVFTYAAEHEGVFPINDLADVRGSQEGTNAHGLFGVLIVEPEGVTWHDPVDGENLTFKSYGTGLYVDVRQPEGTVEPTSTDFVDFASSSPVSFREFTVFIHDEPEIHSGLHTTGEHSVMPLSYRAEPMPNRLPHRMRRYAERTPEHPAEDQLGVDRSAVSWRLGPELEEQFWTARTPSGEYLERVAGEEQHHSSWLFGDPVTPILRAYKGDPCRVRLVHAGVKETHVWHLHVHQWRAVPQDKSEPGVWGVGDDGKPKHKGSQLLDSITIGPQTGMTIDPLYGSGSRQHAFGDVIWHCHLYPHFHHGMWGLWRSFDRLVDGSRAFPDGTPCSELKPLPGRTPAKPKLDRPGFPWFIDGVFPMKSPPPPAAIDAHRSGRRLLLGMPNHSDLEYEAMVPSCRNGSSPGSLFVDLDGNAKRWNHAAGLPEPRVVSYDVEVRSSGVTYNADGWHDPRGHIYRLLRAEVRESGRNTIIDFEARPDHNPTPLYPRANHGDIVELRLHNALTSYPADAFDHAQAPVECGLHVHLVKFDVLAADGSATGWNYLSGASCREAVGSDHPGQRRTVSLHRWVVDEEFGPCFFHDHLLANFRQKHGLWSALIAEPHGSKWQCVEDQSLTAWGDEQAVIVPPVESGLPPYREACLGIGDFVPLLDKGGRALNPPSTLSGDDDPGTMAVNYRSAPLTHRGDDPSLWFSNAARSTQSLLGVPGDPDTPVILTYPGERLRIRLIQGSHEEQHSFSTHGLRWRRDWGNLHSKLVNQQSLGISEAFTLELGEPGLSPYGRGDHLWMFGAMDDLWTGCWGYVRVLSPIRENFNTLAALADLVNEPAEALARMKSARSTPPRPPGSPARTFVVVAQRHEHHFTGPHLTDPWGLRYVTAKYVSAEYEEARKRGKWRPRHIETHEGPLVLRARRGEWVRVFLVNELLTEEDDSNYTLPPFGVEPSPPRLPLEHLDETGQPDDRTISPRVSLHPSLLLYDVTSADGAFIGHNPDTTVAPLDVGRSKREHDFMGHEGGGRIVRRAHHGKEENWTELWWYADEALAPASHKDGPGSVCYLQDMADVRNHRHHGLVGALIVEPSDVTPYVTDEPESKQEAWHGKDAELRDQDGRVVAREGVVLFQNGLRHFVNGHPDQPVPDLVPGDDPEDSGQMAVSYRSALIQRGVPPSGKQAEPPLVWGKVDVPLWLRILGACDKPRQQTLTVHGAGWRAAPWVSQSPWIGGVSGVAPGWTEDIVFTPKQPGDHAVRTGNFRSGTELGLWCIARIK